MKNSLGRAVRTVFKSENIGAFMFVLFCLIVCCCFIACGVLRTPPSTKTQNQIIHMPPKIQVSTNYDELKSKHEDNDSYNTSGAGISNIGLEETRKTNKVNAKTGPSSKEGESVREFKKKLMKKCQMTPEGFFRSCDVMYKQSVPVDDFKYKVKELNLGMDERSLSKLVQILDEDFNGDISLDEFYFALDAFNCRTESESPFDSDPTFVSYTNRSIYKLVKAMRGRMMGMEELFRMIDMSNDGFIDIGEMQDVVKIFDDFKIKELNAIHSFFDIDNNGVIDQEEFYQQMKKAEKNYDNHQKQLRVLE